VVDPLLYKHDGRRPRRARLKAGATDARVVGEGCGGWPAAPGYNPTGLALLGRTRSKRAVGTLDRR